MRTSCLMLSTAESSPPDDMATMSKENDRLTIPTSIHHQTLVVEGCQDRSAECGSHPLG